MKILAENDEKLAARIGEIATQQLSSVDSEEIAGALYDKLDGLEVEEVWDRAGDKRHGYMDTSEAAEQMIDEVIEPYLEDLKKFQRLGLQAEAKRLCVGLLDGLFSFEHVSGNKFKDWAVDAPIAYGITVIEAWKAGSPGQADIDSVRKFIEQELGGWEGLNLSGT